jgi:leucyl aminopeptidase
MRITVRAQQAHEIGGELISLAFVAPARTSRGEAKAKSGAGSRAKAGAKKARKKKKKGEDDAEPLPLPRALARLDRDLGHAISQRLALGDFEAKAGQSIVVHPGIEGAPTRVQLVGLGTASKATPETLRRAAARAASWATDHDATGISIWLPSVRGLDASDAFAAAAEGAVLGAYRFDRYKSGDRSTALRRVRLVADRVSDLAAVRKRVKHGLIAARGQVLARDLSNEPPNELPPAAVARHARRIARSTGLRCKVLGPAELERRKMNALLAVGAGSAATPRLIVLEHRPKGAVGKGTICIIGKGITFDSGGLSLKPATGMLEMKHDMSGAATVMGAMQAAAELGLPVHLVGIVAAAENMPSGTASRPGDVVTSMSGKTIEILNTDAEGRVVLADALHYANVEYAPDAMVDVATLTGAVMVALGPWATGVFGRAQDEALVEELQAAGDASGELMWPLPLLREHTGIMKSKVADLKNTGGPHGGGSTAAAFLAEFAGETPWVHLDIAGSGMTSQSTPYHRGGGTGVGVRTLLEWIQARSQRGRKDGRTKRR